MRLALALALGLVGCASNRPPHRVGADYLGAIRSRDVAQGERTFRTLCAACHAGRVNPAGYHWTAPQMRHQIREGNTLMPALPPHRLSDERVEAVLAYLSTIGAIDGGLPEEPDPTFDEVLDEDSEDEEADDVEPVVDYRDDPAPDPTMTTSDEPAAVVDTSSDLADPAPPAGAVSPTPSPAP